ncbi:MAG TPA: hypothetical protein VIL48_00315 [Acidimicrobiales bacterium]
MLDDLGAGLGVGEGDAGAPLKVGDERRAELGVVGQAGVVGRPAHQRGEPESLLGRDAQVAVLAEHALVPAEVVGVAGGSAEHLAPPRGHVRPVLAAHAAATTITAAPKARATGRR